MAAADDWRDVAKLGAVAFHDDGALQQRSVKVKLQMQVSPAVRMEKTRAFPISGAYSLR